MATIFTGASALKDIAFDLSIRDESTGLEEFTMRTNEVGTLRAISNMTSGFMTAFEKEKIQNTQHADQTVTLSKYQKRAPGAGATRVRQGTGGSAVSDVVPPFFAPIQEGFDESFAGYLMQQFTSELNSSGKVTAAMRDHYSHEFAQIVRNMYTRWNNQLVAWVDTEKWALGTLLDNGGIYTTIVADAKQMPFTELENLIPNMKVEAMKNNFLQAGRPTIIASGNFERVLNAYRKYGSENQQNIEQFLSWADIHLDNEITDGAGVYATAYVIRNSGAGTYTRATNWGSHRDAVNGVVYKAPDAWTNVSVGGDSANTFTNLPAWLLEGKEYSGYADTSGTYSIPESVIDIVDNLSLVGTAGALRSFDPVASVSPIIKYELLA